MPTLLLILGLILTGNNSCTGHFNKNITRSSAQSEVGSMNAKDLLDEIDSCEEPTLRIFLRLKMAAHLWNKPSGSNPEKEVLKALDDLRAHEAEIPPLYLNLFRRDLIAQLQAHAPSSAAKLIDEYRLDRRTDFEIAYSLLGQANGIDKAVGIVRSGVAEGKDPGSIIVPFLHRLEKAKAAAVPSVLDAIMSAEESHPGSITGTTLFTLKHLFIREQTAQALQQRYLAAVIKRAGETETDTASMADTYTIMADILPIVEKQAPDLYPLADAQLTQLKRQVPRKTLDRISIEKRVSQSMDPIAQLMTEKNAVSDPALKEDLQVEAAQLALANGQARMAIDLVVKVQTEDKTARLWRDQFIEEAVDDALNTGDVETSRYGAGKIQSAGIRASALQKIALYLQASNDLAGARETLNSALKLIETSGNSVDKETTANSADQALGLLDLATSATKVDSQRVNNLMQAALTVINKTPTTRKAEVGSTAHLGEVENIMKMAYKIIPTFQALGAVNQHDALDLAASIQRQELKIVAKLGVYTAPPATDKNKQVAASN
jgi:hypothetical protein